jgi:hypothetical protein
MGLTRPELLVSDGQQPPRADKTPVPVTPQQPRKQPRLGLQRISPLTHYTDPNDVFRILFDREPSVDPHTGILKDVSSA